MAGAVVLLSGGLDSGVSLGLHLESGGEVAACLCFDYGQRAAAAEARAAQALAARWQLPFELVPMPQLARWTAASGSALSTGAVALPQGSLDAPGDEASAAAVWVPARNLLFLAMAAARADALGGAQLLVGFNREEAATFADNSTAFVAAMDEVLQYGTRVRPRVLSPILEMDKVEIVHAARRLGLGPEDFYSCYGAGPEPCGRCESCLRSRRAWAGIR